LCVLLETPEKRRVYESGESINASFLFANYGEDAIENAKLKWQLKANDVVIAAGESAIGDLTIGSVKKVAEEKILIPDIKKPMKAILIASVGGVENNWDFWVFPKREKRDGSDLAVAASLVDAIGKLYEGFAVLGTPEAAKAKVIVVDGSSTEVEKALKDGKKVVSIGKADGVPNVSLGWWWIRTQTGSALRNDPVFGDLPHEGVLSPLLFRIVGKGSPLKDSGRSEEDLFMIGEGGEDCYAYLAKRRQGKGIVYESFGLDLLSGTPEGTAILDGMIKDIMKQK
jgi:hypothetical protein